MRLCWVSLLLLAGTCTGDRGTRDRDSGRLSNRDRTTGSVHTGHRDSTGRLSASTGPAGSCNYQGSLYSNNSSWETPSCQSCSCLQGAMLCQPAICTDPRCDQNSQVLRLPAEGCCPVCVSSSEGCQDGGRSYAEGSQWSPSPCRVCVCVGGSVSCSSRSCPPLPCSPTHSFTPTGSCCPQCGGRGERCSYQGVFYQDGEVWSPSACSRCVCNDGTPQCYTAKCSPVSCREHESLLVRPGHCCPECVSDLCVSQGKMYQHGEQWQKDSCTVCVCERGQTKCHTHTCPVLRCPQGQSAVIRSGRCCGECIPSSGATCQVGGALRFHGDLWSDGDCLFCSCFLGQVTCSHAQCSRTRCPEGEEPILRPGSCCPECSPAPKSCREEGGVEQQRHGARWSPEGGCSFCECVNGSTSCFLPSCPSCPMGRLTMPPETGCCPTCLQVPCHPSCSSCSVSPDSCLSCSDPQHKLHQGTCLSVCPDGYYAEGDSCAACPASCSSCSSSLVCLSCGSTHPLLSADGSQCLSVCPPGSYRHDAGSCRRCDSSCSQCSGGGPTYCVACSAPSALLLGGRCVSDCGPASFTRDGVCYDCPSSCASCFHDDSRCSSCHPGHALHDGKCVQQCPAHHYHDDQGRCSECHPSCASCSGPGPTHCSSCSSKLLLLKGRCVEACGGGAYAHNHTCLDCHPSCSSCSGPGLSECLGCLRLDDVLLLDPGHKYLGHAPPTGICREACPISFYADDTHTCRECDSSCSSCFGPSEEECLSCAPPFVLSEQRCTYTCPPGTYREEDTCRGCHPSCLTCSGPSPSSCLSCSSLAAPQSGRCLSSCQEGAFMDMPTGRCHSCGSGCQQCVWDHLQGRGSVCLWCAAPRMLMLGDICVSACPPGYYGNQGACRECHTSCSSCEGAGHLSCTSCPSRSILQPSGRCAASCPPGYHDDGQRVCRACDLQCLTCDLSGSCTACRDPTRVLLFGECQYESCGPQYYLDTSTTTYSCKECDWSCNSCSGPLLSDCLLCMEGKVLQDRVCQDRCRPGFYQEGGICRVCDEGCSECLSLGACLQCLPPLVVQQGRCVASCGRGFFLDSSQRVCKACEPDCLLCQSSSRCSSCRPPLLLLDGRCTSHCGPGYYGDPGTRSCHANQGAPSLRVNGSLLVPLGGSAPLLPSLLEVFNVDDPTDRLLLQLLQPPTNGALYRQEDKQEEQGGGTELRRDETFSWEDLRLGRVRFQPIRHQHQASSQFVLRVLDSQLSSEPQTIPVQIVSLKAPRVVTSAPLVVEERGGVASITKAVLQVEDPDNPEDVVFTVLDAPQHGQLSQNRFRLDELSAERIRYVHDGSTEVEDRFLLQLSDGYGLTNVLVLIHISQKSADAPEGGEGASLRPLTWVSEGGIVRLDRKFLQSQLGGVADDDDIIYTILNTDVWPKYGEVVLWSGSSPSLPDWRPSERDAQSFTSTSSFTQRDVERGAVWYRHYGAGSNTDAFTYQVSTETEPLHHSGSRTFTIGVLPRGPGAPQLDPHCRLQITALEDRLTVFSRSALSFIDSEIPDEKLIYNITKNLRPGQGSVEHQDRPFSPVQFFSQSDINEGKIFYRPPSAPPHLQELYQYSFTGLPESLSIHFTVSNGQQVSPELDFSILFLKNHQQPPLFINTNPQIEVTLGGQRSLGADLLAVSDADSDPDDLEFEVVQAPKHGDLLRSNTHSRMTDGDTFSFSDVIRNVLLYRHSGLSRQEDSITVSVSDGVSMATTVVRVAVGGTGGMGPQKLPESSLSLEVGGANSAAITRKEMAFTDDSSPDDQIRIQLVSVPMFGVLTRNRNHNQEPQQLKEFSSFTMEDINQQRISYTPSSSAGAGLPVTDIFRFVVADGDGNLLDNQMFTITIDPLGAELPLVTVRGHLKVSQSGRVRLSSRHFLVPDVNRKQLKVWMLQTPKYGSLLRTSEVGGASEIITPEQPFSLDDLTSEVIVYVQDHRVQLESRVRHDSFSLYLSDGRSQTEAFLVTVDLQDGVFSGPRVSVSSVSVEENSGVVVTNSSLSVFDRDTPDSEIVFTVIQSPSHGKLRRRQFYSQPLQKGRVLSLGSTFTYQDVLDRLLVYTPNSPNAKEGGADTLGFILSDGISTTNGTLTFNMATRRREGPRMTINRGLRLAAGSSSTLTNQSLRGSDLDSDDLKLRYVVTRDAAMVTLSLRSNGRLETVSTNGPIRSFTQEDINKGRLQFSHQRGEEGGVESLQFNLEDPEGNRLLDQSFFITVLEDLHPPSVEVNKGLVVEENSYGRLSTVQLSASDRDSQSGELLFQITEGCGLGRLEYTDRPGKQDQ